MKILGTLALAGLALTSLGGCVIVDAEVRDHGWSHERDGFGYLYGAEVSVQGAPEISILAHSNGCTQKDDFDVIVDDTGRDSFDVGFRRAKEDKCKALIAEGRRMTWSFAELGIPRNAKVMIVNPVGR